MKTSLLRNTVRIGLLVGLLGAPLLLAADDDDQVAPDLTITTDEDVSVTFNVIPAEDDDDEDKGKGKKKDKDDDEDEDDEDEDDEDEDDEGKGKGKKKDKDDDDEDTATLLNITQPANGTATNNGDGTITYTPNENYNGTDAFTYTLAWEEEVDDEDEDESDDTATGTISVTVNPVNDDPVAQDDAATTQEGISVNIDVLANDSDIDGDALSVRNVRQARGVVHINDDGTLEYRPKPNFTGSDNFFYTVVDGNGGSDEGAVTVNVTAGPANRDPVAQDDAAQTDEDTPVTIDVLANDSDPDGDELSIDAVAQPASGSVAISADGSVTYTPADNFNGDDSFTYTVTDGNGGSATASVSVTVAPVNDAPVADDLNVSTGEDDSKAFTLTAADVDGDDLSYTVLAGPDHGQLAGSPPDLTYIPDLNFNGNDGFTFQVSDGFLSDDGTVNISVGAANDAPLALADNAVTAEDTAVTIDVLANDSDPDGDALSVSGASQGTNGAVAINADGSVTYTPDADFNGDDSFTYTVSDGNGGSATASVSVTVTPINDAPVAVDDEATTNEDTPVTIAVLANDSDVDEDALFVQNVREANGVVHIQGDGTLLYEPTPNFAGQDVFFYTLRDGNGGEDEGQVTVFVGSVNDAPVADDQSVSTDEDASVAITLTASDVDGDALSYAIVAGPTHGQLSGSAPNVSYAPDLDYNGSDAFTFQASDGQVASNVATVTITVTPVNDAPVASGQSVSTGEDESVAITLSASDVDGDALSYSVIAGPDNGQLSGSAPNLTYTPDENYNGADAFTFQASDGPASDQAVITISVGAANDAPLAADDNATTAEDTPVIIDVLANDSDADGDALSIIGVGQSGNGSVAINGNGSLTYSPDENFNGSDGFSYTISDGHGGSASANVIVTVTPVNDAPLAADDAATTSEDTQVTIDVLANDSDVDGDALSIQNVRQHNGVVLIQADGTLLYEPTPNFAGLDVFYYTVRDPSGAEDEAEVTVTVGSVNDAPVADDQSVSTDEDASVAITLTASDIEGDALSYAIVAGPSHGQLAGSPPDLTYIPDLNFNGNDGFTFQANDGQEASNVATVSVTVTAVNDAPQITSPATDTATEDELYTYTATATDADDDPVSFTFTNLSGWLSASGNTVSGTPAEGITSGEFTLTASDGQAEDVLGVTITVAPVNDAPRITSPATDTATEDELYTYTATATDADGDPVSFTFTNLSGWLSASGNTVSGRPAEGITSGQFTVTASDGQAEDVLDVTITVAPVNDAPQITSPATDTATEDELYTYTATATDEDGDPVNFTFTNLSGWLSASGNTVSGTPAEGITSGEFTLTASDGQAEDVLDVTITVTQVNDPPVAVSDEAETPGNTPVTIDVLANDSDPDDDPLSLDSVTEPGNGSAEITAEGFVTYSPNENFSGSDGFSYQISDGNGGVAAAAVTVYVNLAEIPSGAVIGEEGGTVASNGGSIVVPAGALEEDVEIQIGAYADPPPNPDVVGVVLFFGPSGLQFSEPVSVTVPYDPELVPIGFDENDLVVLLYNEGDGTWEALPSVVNVAEHTVSGQTTHFSGFAAGLPLNGAPFSLGSLPAVTIREDASFATLLEAIGAYFADPDQGDELSFTVRPLSDGLDTLFITQGLGLVVIPTENFFGTVSILITASDSRQISVSDTLFLTVTPVNDPPILAAITDVSIREDQWFQVPLAAYDIEGDPLEFGASSDTSAVLASVTRDSVPILLVIPAANWFGTAHITVSASDGQDTTTLAPFAVTVENDKNDLPTAFALLEPADESLFQVQPADIGDSLDFVWAPSADADGDPVTYMFLLSDSAGFSIEYGPLTTSGFSVAFEDFVASIRDQQVTIATFWWSIAAIAGGDTVYATDGPYRVTFDTSTLAVVEQSGLPEFFVLHQNYPNPFNPITTLKYELPAHTRVLLVIYDMRGREVTRLVDGYMGAGFNRVVWNSSDASGRPVPSGIYIARLITPEYTRTVKMTLLK